MHSPFVPLHVKSDYSLGFGTASVDELVERAYALGYTALALTDIENLYGQVRFHHQCRKRGIRAITGIEIRPGFVGRRDYGGKAGRLVLLAADLSGYRSLCRIVSRTRGAAGGRRSAGHVGEDPLPLVESESAGLFALSDDLLVLERLLAGGRFSPSRLGLLVIRPGDSAIQTAEIEYSLRLGIRPVADLDVVFLHGSDHPLHLLQVAVRLGRKVSEIEGSVSVEGEERRLRSPAEAAALFSDLPDALAAAGEIAEECRFDFTEFRAEMPSMELPAGGQPAQMLYRLCMEALTRRGPNAWTWTGGHDELLQRELSEFEKLGLSGFMLIVGEIIAYCRKREIPIVARGSAVSSLVLNLLSASAVDPISQGLLFERFLHRGKSAWPDVDLDLPWQRRDEVIDWVYRHFGHERVAMVAAHHSLQRRAALREGLKAYGVAPALIEKFGSALPPDDLAVEEVDFLGLHEAVEEAPAGGQPEFALYGRLRQILPLVQRLIGRPRHLAAHPGGIVISRSPLQDVLPLERASKGVVITQYDQTALSELGVVKIDLLGNRCLSELQEALRLAGDSRSSRLGDIPSDDPLTLSLIDRADTLGCFQLESPAIRSLLARLPIRRQSDLVAALALIRPGSAAGEAKAAFVRRARGEERVQPIDEVMRDRLAETHGMLLYEEDIMVLLSRAGGLSLAEADELRSAIVKSNGDPEILARLEAGFLERFGALPGGGQDQNRAHRAWAAASRFAAYSFNKAHAASYGRLAYLSAYMKAHYPVEFACALMNHHQGMYPLRTLAAELLKLGVSLLPPHVNFSNYHSSISELRMPGMVNPPDEYGKIPPVPPLEKGGDAGSADLIPPFLQMGDAGSDDLTIPPFLKGGRGDFGTERAVRIGLDKIKGLTVKTAEKILEEREKNGPYTELGDLLGRVHPSRSELAALVLSGACDGLHPLLPEWYPFVHEAALEILKRGGTPAALESLRLETLPSAPQKARAGIASADRRRVGNGPQGNSDLYAALVRVKNELRYFEMHLSGHPVALLRSEAERYGCVTIEAALASNRSRLRLLVITAAMRRVPTRSGIMQFLTLEDETGLLEALVLPPAYRALGDRVTTPGPFLVEGTLRRRQGSVHLEVHDLKPFYKRRQPFSGTVP